MIRVERHPAEPAEDARLAAANASSTDSPIEITASHVGSEVDSSEPTRKVAVGGGP